MSQLRYVGPELPVFALARNWKAYCRSQIEPYVRGRVLEVGAGIGANTALFRDGSHTAWTCLEPDPSLAARIDRRALAAGTELIVGTLHDLPDRPAFDTVMYIDVLEHIEEDRAELARAAGLLCPGGHLIVLAPAHNWLFTSFDRAVGHFRRYSRNSLARIEPAGVVRIFLRYLDSFGMLASLGNRMLLRQAHPTERQILTWDRCLVPVSRYLDRFCRYSIGKTLLGVWCRP